MHPPPQLEMSSTQLTAGSRSRPQARKRANDDAAYFGPASGVGTKRQAIDKVEGEPRVKRKKVEPANLNGGGGVGKKAADKTGLTEAENLNVSLVSLLNSVGRPQAVRSIQLRSNSRACRRQCCTDTLHTLI